MNSYISVTAKILTHPALCNKADIKRATTILSPHRALRPFILNYSLSKFEAPDTKISSPWYAHHDTSISFYFGNFPKQSIFTDPNKTEKLTRVCLFGLLTYCKGHLISEGVYNEFVIKFKPNGFSKLFNIPANKICNTAVPAKEIIGNGVEEIYERLLEAVDIFEMGIIADTFLTGLLSRKKMSYVNEGITQISHQLLNHPGLGNITWHARQANMSKRNFERRFVEQVGTSPKLFCRLVRFNAAIKLKIISPGKSWADIAGSCGYYDTIHMIKEFKQFANASPATLFNNNPGFMKETLLL